MDRLNKILVGIDFSDSSRRALEQALRVSRWNDASIRVFHVVSQQSQSYLPTDAGPRLRELLGEFGAEATTTSEVIVGELLPETLRLAREWSADLLVIGAFGPLGQFTGSGVGVFATQCIRHVPCKVLAVHETLRGGFDRILACVDFSQASLRALQAAIRIARQEAGELHVVHVEPEAAATDSLARLSETVSQLGEDVTNVDFHYELLDSPHPGRAIISFARRIEADLIALGSKGQGDLEYLLMGSTAENVLRSVRRSVLATKPHGFVAPIDRV